MRIDEIERSPSKKLTWILAFFCFGILIGPLGSSIPSLVVLEVSGVILIGSFWCSSRKKLWMWALCCVLLGVFRYQQGLIPDTVLTVADSIGSTIRVEGMIDSDVEKRLNSQQALVSQVAVADLPVDGKLLVRFPLFPEVHYADRVMFTCELKAPQPIEGFAYDRQLASRGVLAVCSFPQFVFVQQDTSLRVTSVILKGRDFLIDRLHQVIPEPHASFISGLLFGGSSSLSSYLREDFSRTGVSHILAASGFNVSIVSLYLLHLLIQSPLGRKRGLLTTTSFLIVYMIAAGATPAVMRATIMAGLLIVQMAIGRRASMRNALLFAFSAMLLINPRLLLDDVGFQLSFVATYALLFIHPRFEHLFSFIPDVAGIRTAVSSSCIAIVSTLPIVLWHFGQLSLIAPIANAIVLPVIPFLMIAGVMAMIGGVWFALPAYGLSFLLLRFVQVLSSLSYASLSLVHARLIAIILGCVYLAWSVFDYYDVSSTRSSS